jgi:hypothetical protein
LAHIFRSLQSGVTVGLEGEAEIVGTRLAATDKQLEIINTNARPSGSDFLPSAEEVAHGCQGFGPLGHGVGTLRP